MKYKVIWHCYAREFYSELNKHLEEGWIIVGEMFFTEKAEFSCASSNRSIFSQVIAYKNKGEENGM